MPSPTGPVPPRPTERPIAAIIAELAELEHHLREAPPHHGGDVRGVLARRQRALEGELTARRRAAAAGTTSGHEERER
jgi:hypothetical protein